MSTPAPARPTGNDSSGAERPDVPPSSPQSHVPLARTPEVAQEGLRQDVPSLEDDPPDELEGEYEPL